MSTNPDHTDNLAWIIREVDENNQLTAPQLAEAILNHPGSLWQPPAALAQPEVGEGPSERDIAEILEHLEWKRLPQVEGTGNSLLLDLALAVLARWGRPPASSSLPANYIDPEHQGGDLKLLQTFYQACHTEGETADEIHLRGLRAVLAARPAAPSAPEPVPDKPAESLAARQLLQKVARLDDSVGITVAEVRQLADQSAAWLRANPPGQPVAIEPRGCPLPGACSCVVPGARPAPEGGDVGEVREWLEIHAAHLRKMQEIGALPETELQEMLDRAATLLQQPPAPAPAVVACQQTDALLLLDSVERAVDGHNLIVPGVFERIRKAVEQPPAPAPAVVPVPVAVEALTRLYWWGGMSGSCGYSADVVLGVHDWINGGMAGDLPPLPACVADRCPPLPQAGDVQSWATTPPGPMLQ